MKKLLEPGLKKRPRWNAFLKFVHAFSKLDGNIFPKEPIRLTTIYNSALFRFYITSILYENKISAFEDHAFAR